MRFILLISLILTTVINAKTQIIIGTFSKQSSAKSVKKELNNIINSDTKFKTFLEKNSIKTTTKKDDKYFLVTLEPFIDIVTQSAVLDRIKKTKFKDAYVLKLSTQTKKTMPEPKQEAKKIVEEKNIDNITVDTPDSVLIQDLNIKEVDIKDLPVVTDVPIKKEVQKNVTKTIIPAPQTQTAKINFVQKYMIEIISFLAILVLIIIYIFFIRNKQKKDSLEDMGERISNETSELEIEKDIEAFDTYDSLKEQTKEEEVYELPEESQPIELDEEILQTQEEAEEAEEAQKEDEKLRSSVEKKEVPAHGKIAKHDFKEFEGMRVMIAEDNLINQKVIKGLLSESGINLTIVDDGEEVIKHLEEDDAFCIILMDVHMPNMDGFEATRIIRANPKYSHITVVALSGDVASDDIANMRAAGMQENLEKPMKMDALYDILYAYGYYREDKINISSDKSETIYTSKELNIETGIEVCGDDEEFYKEILRDFLKTYEDSNIKIQEYLNNNDMESAQKILLDITGVTANIGANNIQNLLAGLKKDIKESDSSEYVESFKKYASHFDTLISEVKEYLS